MRIFECIHPDAILSGDIDLRGTPLHELPRVQFMQDWRLQQPRTVVRDGKVLRENDGAYLNVDGGSSACLAESDQQWQLFDRVGDSNMLMLNLEDPRPSWAMTDSLTRDSALMAGKKNVALAYERAGYDWHDQTIRNARMLGYKVGMYDPIPAWCEDAAKRGMVVHVAALLDWAAIPFYIHRGFAGPDTLPPAAYVQAWRRHADLYRSLLPETPLFVVVCPWIDCKAGTRGHGERERPGSAALWEWQAKAAKAIEAAGLIVWDDPKKQADLDLTVEALKVWRLA